MLYTHFEMGNNTFIDVINELAARLETKTETINFSF